MRRSTVSIIVLGMEAVRTSETSVYFNEITRRYIPESGQHFIRRLENLKPETFDCPTLTETY
jgi:hypothetical protein